MQISDEIKSRLDVVDVIKEYIQLKPVGSNFSALSPFNREKTPSFMVSPEKQIWHCFSSGKGGDVISFIMEMEGVSFVEALRILAPRAGVTLKRENPKEASRRNKLLDIMEIATNYYHQILVESKSAESARAYLKSRNLNEETLLDWKIGFSGESWDDLIKFLKGKGYNDNDIIACGLANRKKETGRVYNRFRERIMFPINDYNGNVVAFSARVSPEKEKEELMGKYVNSPQTTIYNKSKILFGLDKAKTVIKSEDSVIIMEGQMDAITAHQNGFKNVVASSGTALTRDQLSLVKRYSPNIILAFDMDQAGQIAVDRGVREASFLDMRIKIVTLPEGLDPDDLIKKDVKKWKSLLDSAHHIMDYYFDKTFVGIKTEELDSKREAVQKLLPIIARVSDLIERDHWLKKLSQKLSVDENLLRETLINYKEKNKNQYRNEEVDNRNDRPKKDVDRDCVASQNLLALLLKFPSLISYSLNRLEPGEVRGGQNKQIYKNLIFYYNKETINSSNGNLENLNYSDFKEFLVKNNGQTEEEDGFLLEELKLLDKLAILGERDYYNVEINEAKNEVIKIISLLRKNNIRKRMKKIEKIIIDLEDNNEKEKIDEFMGELKILSEELNEIEKQE
ncbi:DNA primase [bacterium]|nr:DNA primase [bacterium]